MKEREEIRYRDRNVLEAFPGRNRFLLGVREHLSLKGNLQLANPNNGILMDLNAKSTSEYKKLSSEETLEYLRASDHGLTVSEVRKRLEMFGYSEIAEKRKNPFIEFLLRYWDPCPGYWSWLWCFLSC